MTDALPCVVVYESRRRWLCHERSLVLTAMSIPHALADGPGGGAQLCVPAAVAEAAREQLRLYERENQGRAPALPPWRQHGAGFAGVAGYLVALLVCFQLERTAALGLDWSVAGRVDGFAIRSGEWWRLVTALTLHADAGHLAANLVFGAVFGLLAGQCLGSGLAWAGILVAAVAGNALNVALQAPGHLSLGASTAVFAALGVAASHIWFTHGRWAAGWARRWAPLVAAVVLLTYLGTGDARTDIVAHLTGFLSGCAVGLALSWRPAGWLYSGPAGGLLGLAALATIAGSWWAALARALA